MANVGSSNASALSSGGLAPGNTAATEEWTVTDFTTKTFTVS